MKKLLAVAYLAIFSMSHAQTGIGTTNPVTSDSSPVTLNEEQRVMLDVKGKMRVRTASSPEANGSYSPVVRDNETGVLEVINNQSSQKPFNYVTYKISNPKEDWVDNLDTRIDANRYSMAVVGFKFLNDPNGTDGFIAIGRNSPREKIAQSGFSPSSEYAINNGEQFGWSKWDLQSIANVYSDVGGNNTWQLHADFAGGGTKFWGNGYWEIHVLIIDNAYVNVLNDISVDLGGNQNGTAPLPSDLD